MTDYIGSDLLRVAIGDGSGVDESLLQTAATVASRRIETITGRTFGKDASPTVKYFSPTSFYDCDFIDEDGERFDLATATGLQVHVDLGYDGSYATSYTNGTDFSLNPVNQRKFGQAWPYTSMTALSNSGAVFPIREPGYNPTVKITGTWGWPAVPDDVVQACTILAAGVYKRKDTTFGIIPGAFDLGGAVRVRDDPMVLALLEPYILQSRWVA